MELKRDGPRKGLLLAAVLMAVGALALSRAEAQSLCAYKTEAGAIVYTNTPTKEGLCAPAAKAPPIGPSSEKAIARYDGVIRMWSSHYGVSPKLVHAVMATESAYNPGAISPKGARGLMQLMPETAKRYAVKDIFDVSENIRGGIALLRDLLDAFGGDVRLAVAAYNAGSQAVIKHSGVPPYHETRDYVTRVMGRMNGTRTGLSRPIAVAGANGSIELRLNDSGVPTMIN